MHALRLEISSCFLFRAIGIEFEIHIFDVFIALTWPSVHLPLQLLLLCDLLPDLYNLLTLGQASFLSAALSIREDLLSYTIIGVFELHKRIFVLVDHLFQPGLLYLILCVS